MLVTRSLIAVGLMAIAAPAEAALPVWNPKAPENLQSYPAFTLENVATVLASIGARAQRSGSDAARPALLATFANGRKALITLASCDQRGCKALGIQSFWVKSATVPTEQTAHAMLQFNQRHAFGKAFVTPDGRPALQHYVTADYGFVRGNLAVNLLVFADQAERLGKEYLQPLQRAK